MKLSQRELIAIRRAAEDAVHAANKHYAPFIDAVAHPLNIIALVDMASKQAEVDHLTEMNQRYIGKMQEQQDQIAELKTKLKVVSAISHMRAAVIRSWKWRTLNPTIKNAIKRLDGMERAVKGDVYDPE